MTKTKIPRYGKTKKLKGESVVRKDIILYNSDGSKIKEDEQAKQLEDFWKTIYKAKENKIIEIWNDERRSEYETELEIIQTKVTHFLRVREGDNDPWREWKIHPSLREHLDMTLQCEKSGIQPMKTTDIYITKEEVEKQLSKMKITKLQVQMA